MVYGGKPSTGCYLCRKRKIKVRAPQANLPNSGGLYCLHLPAS